MRSVALAVLALVLAAPAAGAAPKPPQVDLRLKKSKVDLLDRVTMTITVKNRGRTTTMPEIRLADDSITIVLRDGEKEFRLRRIFGTFRGESLTPIPTERIKLRRTVSEKLEMLAIRPGSYEVVAELRGVEGFEEPLISRPASLDVVAPAEERELRVRIRTSKGNMTARLHVDDAYNTCHEFLRHARDGYYGNGMTFFRIMKGFMVQTGSPDNRAKGFGFAIPAEFNAHEHVPGVLSMARKTHRDSANGQFFVMHGTSKGLDGKYTAFGRVIEGLPVVNQIAGVRTGPNPSRPKEMSDPLERVELYGVDVEVK
jgi:peptidyl-prolyl cis-trans isomerase B (cyclophilin B)